jgi:NAD(P)-dependent dehydrogenase (short-subunit alcohol dehydrogenase family)
MLFLFSCVHALRPANTPSPHVFAFLLLPLFRLSLLILNAGVAEHDHPHAPPSKLERRELAELLDVNVCGTASVVKHMLPLVQESQEKKVVGVTSKMGSMEEAMGDKPYLSAGYRVSKAAENMRE